ncbi:MAG TPA: hypothetical protein VFA89_01685 [Terriglobales bacterium]|nr:hypothetical protein [Terriglobales bacterium]
MKLLSNGTLMATIIATVFGTAGWWFGLFDRIWPTHPFLADLFVSLAMVVIVKQLWTREFSPGR